jgi:hypothetical protein
MPLVINFDPPNAHAAASEWREQHLDELSALPPEAFHIVTGRATDGEFVQITIADEYADRFADA